MATISTGLAPPVDEEPVDSGGKITHIQMLKGGFLIASKRVVVVGDIYPVLQYTNSGSPEVPRDKNGTAALMPVVTGDGDFPSIDRSRAVVLIEQRRAVKHPGPAKLMDHAKTENAMAKGQQRSERAVAQPQRGEL